MNTTMHQLDLIIAARPNFHRGETEIARPIDPSETLLTAEHVQRLNATALTCYGISADVLRFIAANVDEESRTLETGAGCSTLVFAAKRTTHIAITPSLSEIALISEYARQHDIALDRVQFVAESSDRYLPQFKGDNFDLVLLDGKHAFPWPILDWFFTADRLHVGGMMVIDDAQLRSVSILAEFMQADPAWQLVQDFHGKTLVFRKSRASIHDVAWHMQPFTLGSCIRRA